MNLRESQEILECYLPLSRKPVGVKFLFSQEDFAQAQGDYRLQKITYCNAVHLASKGQSLKLVMEHQACFNGACALNMKEVPAPMASGAARLSKHIYDNLDVSKSVSEEMKFISKKPYGVLLAPVGEMKVEPDVVIVVGESYNIMRLIQGYSYYYGYTSNLKTVGLQAVCHDLTTYPYETDDINITFLCPGTRWVAQWQPQELGMGMAFSKWYNVVEGVRQTTNPFVRNPEKRDVIARLEARGRLEEAENIQLNHNYDRGTYQGGPVEVPEEENV